MRGEPGFAALADFCVTNVTDKVDFKLSTYQVAPKISEI
jgi:hypothetical protein